MHLEIITRKPPGTPRPTPLLFIHGSWHGAWCWDEYFLPYFAEQGYIAHAMSLRGHGKSSGDHELRWATVADYVADVEQVARILEGIPVLIGHSLGGYVVQKYLEGRRAAAAVLLASLPVTGMLAFTLRHLQRYPGSMLKTALSLNPYYMVGTPKINKAVFFSPDVPQEQFERYYEQMQRESFRIALDAALLDLPKPVRVNTPMLVLGAANDQIFTREEQENTATAYNTTAEFFPMAHDMMLEPGWQAVADRILVWLHWKGL
ncbi:MAG TPA: alpha/beta hydrolase [Phototrophicaceae bacterium]|nr:alpha/beta hydrolase [Phototrophicaceae bacterium]